LRVHLAKGSCGLDEACDVMMDQVRAIDNARLLKKIGKLPSEAILKVKENLSIVLDL